MINVHNQRKEEEIRSLGEKKKMRIDSKDDPKSWKQNENKINRLETRIQQMQEMFNKDQEEILKRAKQ